MDIKFSVIIPSLNEEHYISHLLKSLKRQSYKNFEVILVDTHSTDKTITIAKSFEKDFPLIILDSNIKNVSHSRNLGASKARGNYFLFIDADNNIPTNFLEISEKYLKNGYDAIVPKFVPSNNRFFDRMLYKLVNIICFLSLFTARSFSTGSSLIIEKGHFEKIKGFDSSLYIAEDHDIVRRLKKNGAKVKFIFDSYVIFSTRRFDQQGLVSYGQSIYCSLYLLLFNKVRGKLYTYEMGGDQFTN